MPRLPFALVPSLCLAACGGVGGGDDGIRQVGDTIIVSDTAGGELIIDGNGCQSVRAPGSAVAEPVTDIDGQPVCTGPMAATP